MAETAPAEVDVAAAERAATSAAAAAQDAMALISMDRYDEAADRLADTIRHAQNAAGKLRLPLED